MRKAGRQECVVCRVNGIFTVRSVVLVGAALSGAAVVGQCPDCLAFVCRSHAELAVCHIAADDVAELQAAITETGFVPTVLCCPFHRVPLGRSLDDYWLLLSRQLRASPTRQQYAKTYIRDPGLYTRLTRGFDFSHRRFTRHDTPDWSDLAVHPSHPLLALKAAFDSYDEPMREPAPIHSDIRELSGGDVLEAERGS
jgi:hypothetical protein